VAKLSPDKIVVGTVGAAIGAAIGALLPGGLTSTRKMGKRYLGTLAASAYRKEFN
jgi:hypothetical protein